MKVFVTNQRNLNFAVDLKLTDESIDILIRDAIPKLDPDGAENIAANKVEFRGEWIVCDEVLLEETISLASMKNLPDFHDHAAFCIYRPVGIRKEWVSESHKQAVNLYTLTSSSKLSGPQFHDNVSGLHPLMNVLVPFKTSPISDWMIGLNVYSPDLVKVSNGLTLVPCVGLDVVRNTELPLVKFVDRSTTVEANGTVTIDFHLCNEDATPMLGREAEVYLDTTAGALSKYRVQTTNSTGSVTFRALDLVPGDEAKIKCGFKYFTGTDDFFIKVV